MKKLMLAIAIAAIFAMGSAAYAEEGKWSIRLEPMWMDVSGNDVHVGDVFRSSETRTPTTYLYDITYEPINLNMKDKLTLRTEITYKKNQWGFGLSGWWFNTDASKSGRVTTPPCVVTPTELICYANGVRMWDHTIMPVRNELEASGLSPVDYWAKNDLKVWTADLFGIRTLAEKKDSHIDMTFGLKLGSLDNDREEGQRQRSFISNHRIAPRIAPGYHFGGLIFAPGFHFDNRITLESTSKADYGLMAGPGIGLSGKAKYKSLGLEGLLNQSLLFGKVKQSGTWTDIDDMRTVTEPAFTIVDRFVLDGRFPFSKSETVALPVTEAKLKFLVDVVKGVSIGIGGFTSIWWNAPLAPKWSMPGSWTGGAGTGWRLQKETLAFYGGTLALNVRF